MKRFRSYSVRMQEKAGQNYGHFLCSEKKDEANSKVKLFSKIVNSFTTPYSEPTKTSKVELFPGRLKMLTFFAKSYILYVQLSSEYTSGFKEMNYFRQKLHLKICLCKYLVRQSWK